MRNLGGAIGIALIDTILYGRARSMPRIFAIACWRATSPRRQAIGLDPALLANRPPGPPDEAAIAFVRPLVEKASLALCVNEAWAMLACVAMIGAAAGAVCARSVGCRTRDTLNPRHAKP